MKAPVSQKQSPSRSKFAVSHKITVAVVPAIFIVLTLVLSACTAATPVPTTAATIPATTEAAAATTEAATATSWHVRYPEGNCSA
jgi:hypothetical protein